MKAAPTELHLAPPIPSSLSPLYLFFLKTAACCSLDPQAAADRAEFVEIMRRRQELLSSSPQNEKHKPTGRLTVGPHTHTHSTLPCLPEVHTNTLGTRFVGKKWKKLLSRSFSKAKPLSINVRTAESDPLLVYHHVQVTERRCFQTLLRLQRFSALLR